MKIRTIALGASALPLALLLAACSQPSMGDMPGMAHGSTPMPSTSTGTSAAFNPADVEFAQMMIPHHQQAVEMADMILDKDGVDSRVTDLAQQIKAAQGPEITTMTGWLTRWGASSPAPMGGMDHGDGMMSAADMDKLTQATGLDASKLFLEQMIQHHEGAITMAQAEVKSGKNTAAIDLAGNIVSAQTSEISEMQTLLSNL